jgi:hypothetical protein
MYKNPEGGMPFSEVEARSKVKDCCLEITPAGETRPVSKRGVDAYLCLAATQYVKARPVFKRVWSRWAKRGLMTPFRRS